MTRQSLVQVMAARKILIGIGLIAHLLHAQHAGIFIPAQQFNASLKHGLDRLVFLSILKRLPSLLEAQETII